MNVDRYLATHELWQILFFALSELIFVLWLFQQLYSGRIKINDPSDRRFWIKRRIWATRKGVPTQYWLGVIGFTLGTVGWGWLAWSELGVGSLFSK